MLHQRDGTADPLRLKKGLGELTAALERYWRDIFGSLPLVNFTPFLFQTCGGCHG
jgi:hypothetical protein